MAFAPPGGGGRPLSSNDASALMQKLRGNAAPANPQTPQNRTDPSAEYLEGLARVRKSLETLLEKIDADKQPMEHQLISLEHRSVMQLIAGVDPQQVIMSMGQAMKMPMLPGTPTTPTATPPPPATPPNPALAAALGGAGGAPPVASLGG